MRLSIGTGGACMTFSTTEFGTAAAPTGRVMATSRPQARTEDDGNYGQEYVLHLG